MILLSIFSLYLGTLQNGSFKDKEGMIWEQLHDVLVNGSFGHVSS